MLCSSSATAVVDLGVGEDVVRRRDEGRQVLDVGVAEGGEGLEAGHGHQPVMRPAVRAETPG